MIASVLAIARRLRAVRNAREDDDGDLSEEELERRVRRRCELLGEPHQFDADDEDEDDAEIIDGEDDDVGRQEPETNPTLDMTQVGVRNVRTGHTEVIAVVSEGSSPALDLSTSIIADPNAIVNPEEER